VSVLVVTVDKNVVPSCQVSQSHTPGRARVDGQVLQLQPQLEVVSCVFHQPVHNVVDDQFGRALFVSGVQQPEAVVGVNLKVDRTHQSLAPPDGRVDGGFAQFGHVLGLRHPGDLLQGHVRRGHHHERLAPVHRHFGHPWNVDHVEGRLEDQVVLASARIEARQDKQKGCFVKPGHCAVEPDKIKFINCLIVGNATCIFTS